MIKIWRAIELTELGLRREELELSKRKYEQEERNIQALAELDSAKDIALMTMETGLKESIIVQKRHLYPSDKEEE